MKSKSVAPALSLRQERKESQRYLWHLKSPWLREFDHQPWWGNRENQVTEEAAMWEVLRRHPQTEKLLTLEGPLHPLYSDHERFLAEYGRQTWSTLTNRFYDFNKKWRKSLSSVHAQWGVAAFGYSEIVTITDPELAMLGKKFKENFFSQKFGNEVDADPYERARKIWNLIERLNEATVNTCSSNRDAFEVLSSGGVLIGFNPNKPGIAERVQIEVRRLIKEKSGSKEAENAGKSYFRSWLAIIAQFEKSELNRPRMTIRDDQLFARYRRIFMKRHSI